MQSNEPHFTTGHRGWFFQERRGETIPLDGLQGDKERKLLAQISSVSLSLFVKNYSTGKQFSCTSTFFLKTFTYLFGCARSKLWHEGSLVATCELLVVTCEIQFPDQGSNFLHWECVLLATGPLGKPPSCTSELYHPALRQEPRKLKCTLQSITSESGSGDQRH